LSPNGRFSEFEKLDKIFFRILNFLDARVWIAADLRVTHPECPSFKSWPRYQINTRGYGKP